MAIRYPDEIDNLITIPKVTDLVSPVRAADHNILVDAVVAIETELGTNPSGVYATVKDRLDALQAGNFSEYLLEKGDLITSTGSSPFRFEVGQDGYVLVADSSAESGLAWQALEEQSLSGSGAATRLTYWSSANTLTSSANLTFDGSNVAISGEIRPVLGIRFADNTTITTALAGTAANIALSNLSSTAVNASLIPGIDDGYDLGSSTLYWRDGYLTRLVIDSSAIFNDSAALTGDFRVKGSGNPALIFADASANMVGIGTEAPTRRLHVEGDGYFKGYLRMDDTIASASTAGGGALKWTSQSLQLSDGYAWRKIFRKTDASIRDLYVDPLAGSDEAAGTEAAPLKTIQEAVYRFKEKDGSSQVWDRGDDRHIHVLHTSGMARITEHVRIPPHVGPGFLIISGEEQVLQSGLTQSGAIAAISGFTVRSRITVLESLTSGLYADSAFVKPTGLDTGRALEDTWDDLPIANNGTNTIDVSAYSPGVFSAINYGSGVTLDIVSPQIVWTWPQVPSTEYYADVPLIVNEGSPLIVRGFIFESERETAGIGSLGYTTFLYNQSTSQIDASIGNPVSITRSIFRPGFSDHDTFNSVHRLVSGDGVNVNGSLVRLELTGDLCMGKNVQFLNVRFHDGYGDVWPFIREGSTGTFILDFEPSSVIALTVHDHAVASIYADMVGAYLKVQNHSKVYFTGSITGVSSNAALQVVNHSNLTINSASGSSGNTSYGLLLDTFSYASILATPTLTGTLGDVKVGNMPVQDWSEEELVDSVSMSIYKNLS